MPTPPTPDASMPEAHTTLLEVNTLAAHLTSPDWVVVDCRFALAQPEAGAQSYRAQHIQGAFYAHLEHELSGSVLPGRSGRHPLPPVERLAATFRSWGMSNTSQLVAYDDAGGAIAARLWWLARWLGHRKVAVLDGGWQAYVTAGLPTTSDIPAARTGGFDPSVDDSLQVDVDEVAVLRVEPGHKLLDAREAPRFRGEVEPIDAVAGHIEGAVSLPFKDNLKDGRFRPRAELRQRFVTALAGVAPQDAVVYCGSGVTACHNLLAAEHAGVSGMRLYPGSYSEWITDPERPVGRHRN